MPVSADTLRLLMDAGVDGAELLAIVESIDNTPKQRSANAERQARFRAKQRESVTDNVISNVTESVTPRTHIEDNLQTKEITGPARKKTAREDQSEFESELSSLLDAERVQALLDVRKKKGGKVNGHAARLLMAKIRDCGLTPIEAADTMVLRNWISIEADWLRKSSPQHATTAPHDRPPRNAGEFARQELQRMGLNHDATISQTRHIDQGDGSSDPSSTGIARRFAIASSR